MTNTVLPCEYAPLCSKGGKVVRILYLINSHFPGIISICRTNYFISPNYKEIPKKQVCTGESRGRKKNQVWFQQNISFPYFPVCSVFLCYPLRHSTGAKTMGLILGSTLRQQRRLYKELFYQKQIFNQRMGEDFVQKLFYQHSFLPYNIRQYNQKVFE